MGPPPQKQPRSTSPHLGAGRSDAAGGKGALEGVELAGGVHVSGSFPGQNHFLTRSASRTRANPHPEISAWIASCAAAVNRSTFGGNRSGAYS